MSALHFKGLYKLFKRHSKGKMKIYKRPLEAFEGPSKGLKAFANCLKGLSKVILRSSKGLARPLTWL